MKLFVYKGFSADFLSAITVLPLVDSEIASKKNVLLFDNKLRRTLDRALLSMDDDEEFWITYEEYALLKDRVELAAKDYGLEVIIYTNNLYPEYYPIEFDLDEELLEEIRTNLDLKTVTEQTTACKNFLSVYNSLESIDGELFASFYNYEFERGLKVTVSPYYPTVFSQDSVDVVDLHVHITNDIPLFLKELTRIKRTQPHCISYSITNGLLSERNLSALLAQCQYNGISICQRPMPAEQSVVPEEELIKIAQNDIKIPSFKSFRKLRFYKNLDINNDVIEVSQAKIIGDIIAQAENAYAEPHIYRDIFITASTGAGKSVMFQIPAIYLAKKYKKLTIIIEPVKALMQDQKEQLNARGFHRVETFNSDLISQEEKEEVLKRVKSGETDLLYLSPETLLSYSMETLIGDREIGLIIVDEAHIVTTWGVGFRPDYWYLGGYINRLRNQIQTKWNKNKKVAHFPICAFTATAVNGGIDDSVSETIISLYMENPIKYIGYVKRDNIRFIISVREPNKLANSEYEEKKATDLISRINEWLAANTKTIAYFPYATYASDASRGIKSFAGKTFDRDKVALYTGRNLDDVSTAEQAERKRKAFDEFRSGEKPVMLATKAFGMGVDINNIVNVYHYAVTGNLCDYVQEIGRVAREPGMTGYAITDYYYNDISFMQRLFGMSQIKQYQINLVLSGIYNAFRNKKENRSFLISPESFTYIFTGKAASDSEDKQINKLKTCLLMLEKDLYDKFNFKVLVSRPQGIFTKAYVVIRKECEEHVLNSQYGKYFSFVAPGRVQEQQSNSSMTISDAGDVFFLDLKAVWEDYYPNLSFPQFKYWYFNNDSNSKDKVEIMPSIRDEFSVRQKVTVETKGELLLCDVRAKILEDFEYIADTLYATFKRTYFTLEEFAKAISPKYGATKARIISNSIFHLVDPKSRCVKHRAFDDHAASQYALSNGTFKERLNRSITRSQLIKNLDGNNNTSLSVFMPLSPEGKDAIALKLLSIFDYATYEVVGGDQPEIFIRLNDPEKIRRIVYGEIKYSNSYVTKAKQKHEREVKILRKFFTNPFSDEAWWDYVERYFLGDDVLREVESVAEEKVDFSKFVDKERSYPINNEDSWDRIAFLFDENIQSIFGDFAELGIPLPNYLSTAVKRNLLDGEIVMSWTEKNVIVFSETISEKDAAVCAKKGWHPFELFAMEPEKLKEAIG